MDSTSRSDDVPRTARDAVLARAARLGDEAWTVLSYASLIGIRIEPALLREATQVPPVVLDEVLGSGLLVDDGATLRFRHEIARRAVEQQVPCIDGRTCTPMRLGGAGKVGLHGRQPAGFSRRRCR